jgi:3-oxoadipate enol-lactonase
MVLEHTIDVAGRPTRYLEAGAGWPLLLVHAFPLSAEMWRPQLDCVPTGWRFIAPDLRGFGAARMMDVDAISMDDYAADLEALLDALDIERAVAAGLSMGGYVIFALLRRSPERTSGLILADTRPQADTAEGRENRRKMRELVRTSGPSAVADQMLPKLLSATSRRERPELEDLVRGLIEANPVNAIDAAIHALMMRPDSTGDLSRIAVPALIIAGADDQVTPVADSELMARHISRSQLVVLPGAAHLSNLEVPDEFSQAIANFLRSNL